MSHRTLTALPVYNEERHLKDVVDQVARFSSDILVIDDGSNDKTADVLKSIDEISIVTHEVNRGYGAALVSAFEYAMENDYDVLITIDCDGQHEPKLIPELASSVFPTDGQPFDMVSGSRYLRAFSGDSLPPEERRLINVEITRDLNERLGLELTDSFCGFKAYRVEALRDLRISELGYAMPLQLWVQAVRNGWNICEFAVPLVYLEEKRSFGGSLDDARRRLAYYQSVLKQALRDSPTECGTGARSC